MCHCFAIHAKYDKKQHGSDPHAHLLLVLGPVADEVKRVVYVNVAMRRLAHRLVATVGT